MYLYEKDEKGIIKVYEMKQNKQAFSEYRKNEMKKIPEGKEILCATTHYIEGDIPYFDRICYNDVVECSYFDIHGPNVYGRENSLLVSQNSDEQKDILLNKFYDGEFENSSILKLAYQICDSRYLLLTDKETEKYKRRGIAKMDNIIEIPSSLYNLQMLNKKRFDLLDNEKLYELLDLYNISYSDELCMEELYKMEKFEIIRKGFYDHTLQSISNDSVFVKKIKPFIKMD